MIKQVVEKIINDYLKTSPDNTLTMETGEPAWEEVIIGYSSGDDPIYDSFKEYVGETHFTPAEIFNLTYPDDPAESGDLTIISWALIQREVVKRDNRKEDFYPSERWVMARFPGEKFNELLRQHVVDELGKYQIQAVAPTLSPHWKFEMSDKYFLISRWSERHAAYASGVGTFGLCDGLITEKGKAHRVGSVVAKVKLDATPRPYMDHHAYCLYFSTGKCMACAKRCPVGAISEKGHDKKKCMEHAAGTCATFVKERWDFDGYGCGLCQTSVPCENSIPKRARQ